MFTKSHDELRRGIYVYGDDDVQAATTLVGKEQEIRANRDDQDNKNGDDRRAAASVSFSHDYLLRLGFSSREIKELYTTLY